MSGTEAEKESTGMICSLNKKCSFCSTKNVGFLRDID
jgi:adenine C2-methylase RlmN of 23S rRNA A2503 and tRNA A37